MENFSSAELRLGMVGCGDIAGYTAWLARLNRKVRVVACCDIAPDQAQAFAKKHKIPAVYTDYAEMLTGVDLHAVYLAVPHNLHHSMILAAIDGDRHILVEKPVTRTLEEGIEVAAAARQAGVKLGVNYQYRYDAGCYALVRAVQDGDLGAIHAVRINIPWHRKATYFEAAAWHKSIAQAGGGALITQGSHLLDIALWALPARPQTVMGYTQQRLFKQVEVEDLAQAVIEMEDGCLVQISSSMVAATEQPLSLEIYGERGSGLYTNSPWPRVRFRGVKIQRQRPPNRGLHALQRSLEGFRTWVVADQPYLTPAEQALPVLAVVEAIYRSAKSGRREKVTATAQTDPAIASG